MTEKKLDMMTDDEMDMVVGGQGVCIIFPSKTPGKYDAVGFKGTMEEAKLAASGGFSKLSASSMVKVSQGIKGEMLDKYIEKQKKLGFDILRM